MTADLRKDERVFLFPKTRTAPSICYLRPAATVLEKPTWAYVTVLVDGEAEPRSIHVDNVVRNLPAPRERATAGPSPKPKKALPNGLEEVPLW